jgi:hypothetical protein
MTHFRSWPEFFKGFAVLVPINLGRSHDIAELNVLQASGDANKKRDIGVEVGDRSVRLERRPVIAHADLSDKHLPYSVIGFKASPIIHGTMRACFFSQAREMGTHGEKFDFQRSYDHSSWHREPREHGFGTSTRTIRSATSCRLDKFRQSSLKVITIFDECRVCRTYLTRRIVNAKPAQTLAGSAETTTATKANYGKTWSRHFELDNNGS